MGPQSFPEFTLLDEVGDKRVLPEIGALPIFGIGRLFKGGGALN
jgi:hypothetical protein